MWSVEKLIQSVLISQIPTTNQSKGVWVIGGGRISANGDLYILEEIDIFSTQGGIENMKMITRRVQ